MSLASLCPFVRYVDKRIYDTARQTPVYAYDFRLFYIYEGHGKIDLCGKIHSLVAHTLILIPPGIPYRLMGEDLFLSVLNFDADYRVEERNVMPPQTAEHFSPGAIHIPPPIEEIEKPFFLFDFPDAESTLFRIHREWEERPLYADERISTLLRGLLLVALRRMATPKKEISPLIGKLLAYIEENYKTPLTNKEIAADFHYHPYYLNKRFVEATGISLHRYLIERRLRAATQLLTQSDKSIEKIAEEVGFLSHAHFTKMFREENGLTPQAYRAGKRAEEI